MIENRTTLTFESWWEKLNLERKALGKAEAGFQDARAGYQSGKTPKAWAEKEA